MSRHLPPLNAARAFEAAFRHESFAKAAAELNVSHAAVSRHVRDLELWLGVTLFERRARGVGLTLAGQRFGAALVPAFDALERATATERPGQAGKRITVTLEPVFAQRWLLRRLSDFQAAQPQVEIVLDPSNRLVDVGAEGVDMGVRYGQGNWPGVDSQLLARVDVYPVAAPPIAAQLPPEPTSEDLRRFTLVHEDGELWSRWFALIDGEGREPPSPPGLMLHDTHLAIEAAALGAGIALGDSVLDIDDLKSGRLIRLTPRSMPCHAYWIVTAPRRRLSAPARLFRDWLLATMAADLPGAT
jgi:LysR family glycine cleavage system transcriptional activator